MDKFNFIAQINNPAIFSRFFFNQIIKKYHYFLFFLGFKFQYTVDIVDDI